MASSGGLTVPEKIALGMVESTDLFKTVDAGAVGAHAANLENRFKGISSANMARMLLSFSIGLETAIMSSDDPEIQVRACKAYCLEMQILAAAITRKERGLPPLGVNGGASATEEAVPADEAQVEGREES